MISEIISTLNAHFIMSSICDMDGLQTLDRNMIA